MTFDDKELNNKQKIIFGYKTQSNQLIDHLIKLINNLTTNGESIIIEGVHITTKLVKILSKKFRFILPFFIYIEKYEKHKERFFVRSKNLTLDPKKNKYVQYLDQIRIIQSHIIKNAEITKVPLINNSNIDKSVCLIQQTILKSMWYLKENNENKLFDSDSCVFYKMFEFYKKNEAKYQNKKKNYKLIKMDDLYLNLDSTKDIKNSDLKDKKITSKFRIFY